MSQRQTILLMSRGARTHLLFKEMAADLVRDFHVVILAAPEEQASFLSIEGTEVHLYETQELPMIDAPNSGVSLAKLRSQAGEIEKILGLPLYKSATNYLLYGRIVRDFGGSWKYLKTERQVLETYIGSYRQLVAIFETTSPHLVFFETIDMPSSYIAFALAWRRGIFAIDLRISPFSNGDVSVGFGMHRKNIVLEYLYGHPDHISESSYVMADSILGDPEAHLYGTDYAVVNRNLKEDNSIFNPARLLQAGRNIGKMLDGARNVKWHMREAANRLWLRHRLSGKIPQTPFLVFFLQHLPEASTTVQAPRWVYQDAIVEQLAINAPSGMRIVVKEHPRTYGKRGRSFFKHLLQLPNVDICPPETSNLDLIRRSEAVLAITGTAGLEAIVLGKRVAVLGRPYYSVFEGVQHLDCPERIFDLFDNPAWEPTKWAQQRRTFLASYSQSLNDFGHVLLTTGVNGGARWAQALRKTLSFIQRHGLTPSLFDDGFGLK